MSSSGSAGLRLFEEITERDEDVFVAASTSSENGLIKNKFDYIPNFLESAAFTTDGLLLTPPLTSKNGHLITRSVPAMAPVVIPPKIIFAPNVKVEVPPEQSWSHDDVQIEKVVMKSKMRQVKAPSSPVRQAASPMIVTSAQNVPAPAPCLQIVNGQLVVQAQLQQVQTATGYMTVAVLPSLGGLNLPSHLTNAAQSQIVLSNQTSTGRESGSPGIKPVVKPKPNPTPRTIAPRPNGNRRSTPRNGAVRPSTQSNGLTVHLSQNDATVVNAINTQIQQSQEMLRLCPQDQKQLELKNSLETKRSEILQAALQLQQRNETSAYRPVLPVNQTPATQPTQIVQVNGQQYLMVSQPPRTESPQISKPPTPNLATCSSSQVQRRPVPVGCFTGNSNMGYNPPPPQAGFLQMQSRPVSQSQPKPFCNAVRKRIEQKKDRIRLQQKMQDDLESLSNASCDEPFQNKVEAIERLMPYHLYYEPDLTQSFQHSFDLQYESVMKNQMVKKRNLENRFRASLLEESQRVNQSTEEEALLSYLLARHEGDLLEKDKEKAAENLEKFVSNSDFVTLPPSPKLPDIPEKLSPRSHSQLSSPAPKTPQFQLGSPDLSIRTDSRLDQLSSRTNSCEPPKTPGIKSPELDRISRADDYELVSKRLDFEPVSRTVEPEPVLSTDESFSKPLIETFELVSSPPKSEPVLSPPVSEPVSIPPETEPFKPTPFNRTSYAELTLNGHVKRHKKKHKHKRKHRKKVAAESSDLASESMLLAAESKPLKIRIKRRAHLWESDNFCVQNGDAGVPSPPPLKVPKLKIKLGAPPPLMQKLAPKEALLAGLDPSDSDSDDDRKSVDLVIDERPVLPLDGAVNGKLAFSPESTDDDDNDHLHDITQHAVDWLQQTENNQSLSFTSALQNGIKSINWKKDRAMISNPVSNQNGSLTSEGRSSSRSADSPSY